MADFCPTFQDFSINERQWSMQICMLVHLHTPLALIFQPCLMQSITSTSREHLLPPLFAFPAPHRLWLNSRRDLTVLAYGLRAPPLILCGSHVYSCETQTYDRINALWDEQLLMEMFAQGRVYTASWGHVALTKLSVTFSSGQLTAQFCSFLFPLLPR